MNSYTKFEENRSMNVQDRARKRNADGRTDRQTDGQTDGRTDGHSNANFFGGYNIIPRTFFKWRGITKRVLDCHKKAFWIANKSCRRTACSTASDFVKHKAKPDQ